MDTPRAMYKMSMMSMVRSTTSLQFTDNANLTLARPRLLSLVAGRKSCPVV